MIYYKKLLAIIFIGTLCFAFMAINSFAFAEQESLTDKQRIQELEAEVNRLKSKEEHYEFLKSEIKDYRIYIEAETKRYREFAERDRSDFQDTFQLLIWVGAGLLSLVGLILVFFFGNSIKEVKVSIQDSAQKEIKKIRELAINNIKQLVNQETETFSVRFQALQQVVDRELTYKQARILVTGEKTDIEQMKMNEIPVVNERGINNIKAIPYNLETIKIHVDSKQTDIIVFRYRTNPETNQDTRVREIAKYLKDKHYHIPFIIYTYKEKNLSGDDLRRLSIKLSSNL